MCDARRMSASHTMPDRLVPRREVHEARRDGPHPLVWLLVVACAAGFAVVAWLVSTGATQALDRQLLLGLRVPTDANDPLGPDWFEKALAEITALGGYTILVILFATVLATLLLNGERRAALFLALTVGGGALVSSGLKALFHRPRPDLVDHLDQTFTSSFPSAHAMVSTLAYLTLATVGIRFLRRHETRVFLLAMAVLLAFAIGASRVYLGVHWPSDVLAGWLAGAAWAGATWLAADAWTRSFSVPGQIGHSRL